MGRSKVITKEQALNFLDDAGYISGEMFQNQKIDNPDFDIFSRVINKTQFIRGLFNHDFDNFLYIDPAIHERESLTKIHFGDYYNILFENLPAWKQSPKRSKSIIGFHGYGSTDFYGKKFYVFPLENKSMIFSPSDDIWESFANYIDLKSLNFFLKSNDVPESYNSILNFLEKITPTNFKTFIDFDLIDFERSFKKLNLKTFKDILIYLIPYGKTSASNIANNSWFYLSDARKNNDVGVNFGCECWTESKCVLINSTLLA